MQKNACVITVFFDNPFWVSVYERISDGKLEVCKTTFGAEPKDYEVYDFLLKNWNDLRFGPAIQADKDQEVKVSPKRMQRTAKRQLDSRGIGTKAQQALKEQRAEGKETRKKRNREEREAEKQRQFALRRQKRKDRHKGA